MLEIEITDSGFADVISNLEAITPALAADVIGNGLRAAADVVRDHARRIVPVRTGALRRSIRSRYATTQIQTSRGRRKVSKTGAIVLAGNRRGVRGAAQIGLSAR